MGDSKVLRVEGKIVGRVEKNVYITHRNRKKHYFFKGRGYPISDSILQELKKRGVERILIIENSSGEKFEATVTRYLKAKPFKIKGHDTQRVIPLESLDVKTNQLSLLDKN